MEDHAHDCESNACTFWEIGKTKAKPFSNSKKDVKFYIIHPQLPP